jgi:hypothetical protein
MACIFPSAGSPSQSAFVGTDRDPSWFDFGNRARNAAEVGADPHLFPTANLPLLVRIKISQDGDMICIDMRNEWGL